MQARRHDPIPKEESLLHVAIERVYRAGMGDVDWLDALAMLARAHDADGAMLFTPGLPAEAGGLSASFDSHSARAALHSVPQVPVPVRSATGRAFSTVLSIDGDDSLPATLFLLFRADSAPPLAERDVDAIQLCCRHLALSVRLWYRDRFAREGSEALASRVNAAALIADEQGRVAWMNERAEQWKREQRIAISDGRLTDIRGASFDLPRALRAATERGAKLMLKVDPSITTEILPVPLPHAGRKRHGPGRGALVILRDRMGSREVAAALAANFRLTATEVDLAIALWKGILIAEYAAQRSVAMTTVRTQLKSLLGKTGARRQSDVVGIVARLQPVVGDPSNGG
jgi:hypothetical protein